jgi:hypothetical protein
MTPLPTGGTKLRLTNYTVVANDYLSIDLSAGRAMPPLVLLSFYVLSAAVALAVAATLALNVATFGGMPDSEYQRWALRAMYLFPEHFHLLLCVDRAGAIAQLTSAGAEEEAKEAKRARKSERRSAQGASRGKSEEPLDDQLGGDEFGSLKFQRKGLGGSWREETKEGKGAIELRGVAATPQGGAKLRSLSGAGSML